MSQEIVLVAIITIAPGKWPKLNEVLKPTLENIERTEPGTLEFRVFQESEGGGSRAMLVERYASQEALDHHRSTDAYQSFFKIMQEEEILGGAPQIITGKYARGFWRS